MSDLDVYLPAIAAGDPDAFALWVAVAEPRVRKSVLQYAARVDVEVVVQETLLRMWQVAPRVVADAENALLRLAVRSARNLCIDELRRRREVLTESGDRESAGERDTVEEPELPDPLLRAAIAGCEQALPQQPRRVLLARLTQDGTRDDASLAEELGMRLNTFLQNFGRARRLLAECLQGRGISLTEIAR